MDEDQCANCRFFNSRTSECRAASPGVVGLVPSDWVESYSESGPDGVCYVTKQRLRVSYTFANKATWPKVSDSMWCGYHQRGST